jgi:hypothetical protein
MDKCIDYEKSSGDGEATKACTERKDKDTCEENSYISETKSCYWYGKAEKCVELDRSHKCSAREDETFCEEYDSCKWDSACKDKVCADYTENCNDGARTFE